MTFARPEHSIDTDTLPRMPAWVTSARPEAFEDVAFLSGAALNHLHLVLGREEVPKALLRDRLALRAAEACVGFSGRPERAADLRDAVHLLRPGDLPGPAGETYLAWQLPNSYLGQHQHRPKGQQKRINRELKDLVMQGMPGNGEGTSETQKPEKVYFPNGKLAAKAYGRDPERDLYWKRHRTENGRFSVWQQLGG